MTTALLTSGGLSLIRDWLAGKAVNPPSYIALSSGVLPSPNPIGSFWSRLPGETFRSNIVSADTAGQSVTFHGYFGLADNNQQTVCYYGLFGGNPTLSANTGTLIAVAQEPSPFSKAALTTLSIDIALTVSGVIG